jgi:hypothetical protein
MEEVQYQFGIFHIICMCRKQRKAYEVETSQQVEIDESKVEITAEVKCIETKIDEQKPETEEAEVDVSPNGEVNIDDEQEIDIVEGNVTIVETDTGNMQEIEMPDTPCVQIIEENININIVIVTDDSCEDLNIVESKV